MSIELRCSQCQSLLNVPDEAAGKQARCPKCQTLINVPGGAEERPNPFAEARTPQAGKPERPEQSVNPYAAPSVEQYSSEQEKQSGQIRLGKVRFGEAFSTAITAFNKNVGAALLATLAFVGLLIVVQLGFRTLVEGVALFLISEQGAGIAAGVAIVLLGYLVLFGFMAFMVAGASMLSLKAAKGERASVGDLFAGGPYFIRVAYTLFIIYVVQMVCQFVVMIPAIALVETKTLQPDFAFLVYFPAALVGMLIAQTNLSLTTYFIVDRNMGGFEAMGATFRFMHGNRFVVFGVMAAAYVAGMLISVFTCMVGGLFAIPFITLLWAVVYLQTTSQPTIDDLENAPRDTGVTSPRYRSSY